MEASCHGIACVPMVISGVAYMWSQDGSPQADALELFLQSGFGLGERQYVSQINKPGQNI